MLKDPAASVSQCMPPVNVGLNVDGADVWVSRSPSLFFPISISVFFVLAVVQGHYVMLMRAPHLEKCH